MIEGHRFNEIRLTDDKAVLASIKMGLQKLMKNLNSIADGYSVKVNKENKSNAIFKESWKWFEYCDDVNIMIMIWILWYWCEYYDIDMNIMILIWILWYCYEYYDIDMNIMILLWILRY